MLNVITKTMAFAILVGVFAGCASNDVVSGGIFRKRKYTSGFYHNASGTGKRTERKTADRVEEGSSIVSGEQKAQLRETAVPESVASVDKPAVAAITEKNHRTTEAVAMEQTGVRDAVKKETAARGDLDHSESRTESRSEKKITALQKTKAVRKHGSSGPEPVLYVILCIFIPFVAVGLATDWDTKDVVINLLLCCLCGIPGIIHAFIVCKRERVL